MEILFKKDTSTRPNGGPAAVVAGYFRVGVLQPENDPLWEAAVNEDRVGAIRNGKMGALLKQLHVSLWLMIHTPSITLGQYHVLPGPPIRLNLLTMLGPISSYSALV